MAYYLTYRPQTIDQLDNQAVRETLISVLRKEDVPHAFLFTGPKGLGKTSSARIVAKAVNCTSRHKQKGTDSSNVSDVEPCNTCEMCVSITNGSQMDVLEIDAASNRGIDEIRDLREKIRLAPTSATKKVYIIDEVHMLTTEAFNALLKTLEEPPKHAMFILATTEPHKVPETIISRCLHVSFSKATAEELQRSFARIVTGESLDVSDDVLFEIARLSDGGFRDGVKILEELVSLSDGKKITRDILEKKFHTKSIDQGIEKLLTAFTSKDMTLGLQTTKSLSDFGVDFGFVLQVLLQKIHTILLVKTGVQTDDSLKKFADALSFGDISRLFEILSKSVMEMKHTIIAQLPLELAIVEFSDVHSVESAVQPVTTEKLEKTVEKISVQSLRKEVGKMTRQQLLSSHPAEKVIKVGIAPNNGNLLAFKSDGDVTDEWLEDFWQAIIHKMKDHNHTVAGVMRGCRIKSYDRTALVIETKFAFHKDKLGDDKMIAILEDICKHLTGKTISVSVELVK